MLTIGSEIQPHISEYKLLNFYRQTFIHFPVTAANGLWKMDFSFYYLAHKFLAGVSGGSNEIFVAYERSFSSAPATKWLLNLFFMKIPSE